MSLTPDQIEQMLDDLHFRVDRVERAARKKDEGWLLLILGALAIAAAWWWRHG